MIICQGQKDCCMVWFAVEDLQSHFTSQRMICRNVIAVDFNSV